MSQWYEPKLKDMYIDGDEINIYVTNNDFGRVYAAVKITDIKKLLDEQTKE